MQFFSGAVFPLALFLIVFTGSELFTGNCMYLPAAVLAGKASWRKLCKSWVWLTSHAAVLKQHSSSRTSPTWRDV